MRVSAVESTTLATVGYDEAGELQQLEFRRGAVYRYLGVPAAVYGTLLEVHSKGQYFNHAIRGRFAYRLVSVARQPRRVWNRPVNASKNHGTHGGSPPGG